MEWFYLADFVLKFANDGKFIPITDLWTLDRTPQDPAEWKRATLVLVRHFFGDLTLWVPETRPGILSRRFARRDRIRRDAARPL